MNEKLNKAYQVLVPFMVLILGGRLFHLEFGENKRVPAPTNKASLLKPYIKQATVNDPKKMIVFLQNGYILDKDGRELYFDDEIIINNVKERLNARDFSHMTLGLSCVEPVCINDYNSISLGLQMLNPSAVVFHSNSSGLNTDIIGKGLNLAGIPIIVYGTELGLDYQLYVGTDNARMGKRMGEWLKSDILSQERAKKPNVVFLHTVKGINADKYENGEPRIKAVKEQVVDLIDEIEVESTFWSSSKAFDIIKDLEEKPDYIVIPSPTVARGVTKAIVARKWVGEVNLLVLGADPWSVEQIKLGTVKTIIPNGFLNQADKLGLYLVNEEFRNRAATYRRTYSGNTVTRENLYEIEQEDGSYAW